MRVRVPLTSDCLPRPSSGRLRQLRGLATIDRHAPPIPCRSPGASDASRRGGRSDPMSGPVASISSFAPMAAAFFICSTGTLTTSNSAWVTTIRSQPASRANSMIARHSVGDAWPVQSTSFCWAQIFAISRSAGSALPSGTNDLDPFRRVLEMLDVVVGVEGRQPDHSAVAALHRHIHWTASGLRPPAGAVAAATPRSACQRARGPSRMRQPRHAHALVHRRSQSSAKGPAAKSPRCGRFGLPAE
jgi:hypothetical protein